jgi:competence protein ComFC
MLGAFECGNCKDADLAFESVRAAVLAEGVVRKVVHRFKYDGAVWFRPFLGGLLVRAARPALSTGQWDVLVPVPLHPTREREREFNQAELLARFLGRHVGLPVRTDLVERIHETPTQTHLGREARQENVRRAFRAIAGRSLKGASAVVVDDVLTTGSTTDAVARQLRRLGAERVCVWVVARAR